MFFQPVYSYYVYSNACRSVGQLLLRSNLISRWSFLFLDYTVNYHQIQCNDFAMKRYLKINFGNFDRTTSSHINIIFFTIFKQTSDPMKNTTLITIIKQSKCWYNRIPHTDIKGIESQVWLHVTIQYTLRLEWSRYQLFSMYIKPNLHLSYYSGCWQPGRDCCVLYMSGWIKHIVMHCA